MELKRLLKVLKKSWLLYCLVMDAVLTASSFQYKLNLQFHPGQGIPILCLHGYGSSSEKLLSFLQKHEATQHPLITFNFPDFDLLNRGITDPHQTTFGTIEELLPALYAMKKSVIDQGMTTLNLYGISAGGAAVINCLCVLHTPLYEDMLQTIDIHEEERVAILQAIQNGIILLDVPLKSLEENMALRGESPELSIVAERYRQNGLRPIDSLKNLSGLKLNILLFFQTPDETLSNRDDLLFIEELTKANTLGQTHVMIANEGNHRTFHRSLWQAFHQLKPD